MGPLVPDIITNELNLIVALLVGIAFGFILEQAGFSSSRKLTGLFYGTDFTVLRVFFAAGVTAMLGVLLLTRVGLLDASIIYVNPAFLPSAIVGGLIMGVGFVVGGFCPGTSFCASAVGRIDGMVFVAGSLAGVLVFGEAFPAVRGFYNAGALGEVTVPAYFGIAPGAFAIGLAVVAIAVFVVVGRIERRVNGAPVFGWAVAGRHRLAAAALVTAALVVALVPEARQRLLAAAADPAYQRAHPLERMTADELAFRIVDNDPTLLIVDVRPAAEVSNGRLPGAVSVAPGDLFGRSLPPGLAERHRRKVFVSEDGRQALDAATLATALGFVNVAVLDGGLRAFRTTILDATGQPSIAPGNDVAAFRADAGRQIAALIRAQGAAKKVERPTKKIVGGCGV